MLCERCKEREATVFMTTIICGEMSKTILCQQCFETEHPEAALQAQVQIEAGCRFCGRQCGSTICQRCSDEFVRILKSKGFSSHTSDLTQEQLADKMRIMQEVEAHMKEWVAEQEPQTSPDSGEIRGPIPAQSFPPDAIFERVAQADSRFKMEAYRFVAHAVRAAFASHRFQHVSGRDVALAFRSLAVETFGNDALDTLIDWGVYTTADIGTIVFIMVQAGLLGARPEDKPEDFQAIYDFATAFPRE
jgi:uncharacterized repeat protein (TIGR04138 family)